MCVHLCCAFLVVLLYCRGMPGGRGNRRDVKHLSKNRFSRLDADIASSYVDDDEGTSG